jgi:poly(3-hydroxybutyrate) depolymerase
MARVSRLLLPVLIAGCSPANEADSGDEAMPEPAPVAGPSEGTCPALASGGVLQFASAGVERTIHVFLPDGGAEGAPLLFVWYPLGWSAGQFASAIDAASLARELDMVVVLPEETEGNLFAWEFLVHPSPHDLTLFEDVRSCASEQLAVDLHRVYTTGMSAGGLFSTYLTMHRSDALAASLIFSGGTEPVVEYEAPEEDIPVLLFHGGASDTFAAGPITVDFYDTTQSAAADLAEDGSLVIVCAHSGGHTLPPSGFGTVATWLLPHRFGASSPFEDGDLSALPAGCASTGS